MKKLIKKVLTILVVFTLMSASIMSVANVNAKAVDGEVEHQEEITDQEDTDLEDTGIADEEEDLEESEESEESENEETEDPEETEETEETEEPEEDPNSAGIMMMLGTSPEQNPIVSFDVKGEGTAKYKIGEESEWQDASNITTLDVGTKVYIKATPNEGKALDNNSGQNMYEKNVEGNRTQNDFELSDLTSGNASFTIEENSIYFVRISFVNNDDPGPGPSVDNGKYIVSISNEVSGSTGSISVEFLNNSDASLGSSYYSSSTSEGIDIPSAATKVKISVTAGSEILNNARLENRTDGDEADLIDDMRRDETTHSSIKPIDSSKAYEIKITFSNTMSVSWTYNTSDPRKDMIVEHARIELLNSDNANDYKEKGRTDWQLTVGETYYFVLIPDNGYQVSGLNINGQAIEPKNSIGVFSFVMSHSNFHLQGIVREFDDIANKDGEMLGGISVDGAGAVDSGNVMISERDIKPDSSALSAISDSDAQVFGTMDLKLDQVISKGREGEFWATQKNETSTPINISVVIPAGELSEGETYSIVRKHDGVYEELNANYDPSSEKLSFASNKFSEYTIVKKKAETPSPTPSPSPSPSDTPTEKPTSHETSSSDASGFVPAAVPDTTVIATIGGTIVTEKDTKDNVAVLVGGSKTGVKISEWNELATYLALLQTAPLATQTPQTAVSLAKPIELVLCKKNTVVPEIVFDSLAVNPAPGLHIHIHNGVAVNFFNDPNLVNQKAIDLKCSITAPMGYAKRIAFNSDAKLFAITTIHATVPKSIKSVNVYTIDKKGKKTLLWANVPVTNGRYCFLINQLGTFEIEY